MDQASTGQTTKLSITKMDCPTEETLIRNKLGTMAGVADLDFNLMQRTLSVRHADQVLPDVLAALQALGFEAQVAVSACSTGNNEGSSCRTAKVRCIRLNSRPTTPASPTSLPRISASSVGQSMFSMRYTA